MPIEYDDATDPVLGGMDNVPPHGVYGSPGWLVWVMNKEKVAQARAIEVDDEPKPGYDIPKWRVRSDE